MKVGTVHDLFSVLRHLIKNALLFVIVVMVSYVMASFLGFARCMIGLCDGWFDAYAVLAWIFLWFYFSLFFVFTIWGGKYKYLWIFGIIIFIILLLQLYGNISIFFLIAPPSVLGWGLGKLILKFLQSKESLIRNSFKIKKIFLLIIIFLFFGSLISANGRIVEWDAVRYILIPFL